LPPGVSWYELAGRTVEAPTCDGDPAVLFPLRWPGVEFEVPPLGNITHATAGAEIAAGALVAFDENDHVVPALPGVPAAGVVAGLAANDAAAPVSQQQWNRMIGGILEDMITQDGLLPGGDEPDDEEDEDDTDTDPPA
jgi:hypothetical protein